VVSPTGGRINSARRGFSYHYYMPYPHGSHPVESKRLGFTPSTWLGCAVTNSAASHAGTARGESFERPSVGALLADARAVRPPVPE